MKEQMDIEQAPKSSKRVWSTAAVIAFVIIAVAVVATLCTTLTFFFHPGYDLSTDDGEGNFEPIPEEPDVRVNCIPDRDQSASEELCSSRGCIWRSPYREGEPWCYFPGDYGAYHVVDVAEFDWGTRLRMDRHADFPSFFNGDVQTIVIDIEYQTNDRLHAKVR